MAFTIPSDLNPKLMPLAWLIGTWVGNGHGSWPGRGDFEYGIQVDFADNGSDYLHYICQTYLVDENSRPLEPLWMETGFWRPSEDKKIEVVLADPQGRAEVWVGDIDGAKIALTTDLVARTETADPAVTGGQRLYGQVEADLWWAYDRASEDVKLQPYMWAKLKRA